MPPVINKAKCVKCELCVQICPLDVIKVEGAAREIAVRYPEECWHCRACAIECPQEAITMRYPLSHMMFHVEVPNLERGEA
ncbi:MAG: 4Fe-4S binding protein [Peptococcaceae bacterium]|nr:4Fe-4S binding protein [Peptococcaceae bacterium]